MWEGPFERRQSLTPYTGPDRRQRPALGAEPQGARIWAALKHHRVPVREHHPSPRMAHWEATEQLDLWE